VQAGAEGRRHHAGADRRSGAGRRIDAHSRGARNWWTNSFISRARQEAAHRAESRRSGRAGRGGAGRHSGRRSKSTEEMLLLDVTPLRWASRRWAEWWRASFSATRPFPPRPPSTSPPASTARPTSPFTCAGRARAGRRLPLAGALRPEGHSADERRAAAHRGQVPHRRRRHSACLGARAAQRQGPRSK
jgi:hypothetical protein